MLTISILYLILMCFSVGKFTDAGDILNTKSTGCSRNTDECELDAAGQCSVILPEGINAMEPRDPEDNRRSRFRSCIGQAPIDDDAPGTVPIIDICELNRLHFTDQRLVGRSGPENETVYNFLKVFSAGFNEAEPREYRTHEFSLFNLRCNSIEEDSIMSVTLATHELDPKVSCDGKERCVDVIRTFVPTREICETCGSKPLTCRPGDDELPEVLHFDGIQNLKIQFQSNGGRAPGPAQGFEFLTTCVVRSFFFSELCITPEDTPQVTRRNVDNLVPTLVRAKRSYRKTGIVVTADTTVTYSNFTVRVFREDVWLYKFPNIRFFQVFNFVVGFQIFSGDATPEGRTFPGYGVLKIGIGIIRYIQTAIEPEFLPSPAETEIILRLQRRIIPALPSNSDPLVLEEDDDEPVIIDRPRMGSSPDEIAQMDRDAMMFGRACNGILRANACIYQELFFGNVTADCLE